ncbi:MAG: hypothetical protein Roseis2KO_40580 [Roseivirga sp.]
MGLVKMTVNTMKQLILILTFVLCTEAKGQSDIIDQISQIDSVQRIEMSLSAFGVESDSFPSIEVEIDFLKNYSLCKKTFYNPAFKPSDYSLTERQMKDILDLLKISELESLKEEYSVNWSDQPRSITTVYTKHKKFVFNDYGLEGPEPLKTLYKLVYRIR